MPTYEEHYHDAHDRLYGPTLRRVADAGTGDTGAAAGEGASAPALPEPPPRAGSGSGREAQATYATDVLGLTVTNDMTRDDIVAMIDEKTKE